MVQPSEKHTNRRRTRVASVFILALALLISLCIAEIFLRIQDGDAPIVKLSGFTNTDRLSLRFHHRRGPSDGAVEITREPPNADANARVVKVLLLGDSWMERCCIGQGFAEYVGSRMPDGVQLELINGGTSSFAPSLILLQGEFLIAEHNPDIVLVNIDETDLMDETLRYRDTSVFGVDGRLISVVPNRLQSVQASGHVALLEQPLYVLRLVEKVYFDRVLVPRLRRDIESEGYTGPLTYDNLLGPQLSADPYNEYADEIGYFRERVEEMVERLTSATCSTCVLLSHHPHLLNLTGTGGAGSGPKYNAVVAEVLQQVASESGIMMFDALHRIPAIYGKDYAEYFRWPEDPYSHLTEEGYHLYGMAIGEYFYDRVAATWTPQ